MKKLVRYIPDDYCSAMKMLLETDPVIPNIYQAVEPAMASAEEIAARAFPMTEGDRQAVERVSRERGYRRIEMEWMKWL